MMDGCLDHILAAPVRALPGDDPFEILSFAAEARREGTQVVLATLVGIRGGAARSTGSHMAVAADGRFCGYVSGGCVEAAVASMALRAIAEGRDRSISFGDGSPFFDIVLPCGGGIDIALHVLRDGGPVEQVLDLLQARTRAGLSYAPAQQALTVIEPPGRAGWQDGTFVIPYRPRTRIVVAGETLEARMLAAIAEPAGCEIIAWTRDQCALQDAIDPHTAVVLLHHDLDAEERMLDAALSSPAFYIGALGSTRTHRKRVGRLSAAGWPDCQIERIRAPIGFFGPTRDSRSLAVSVLADICACHLAVYG